MPVPRQSVVVSPYATDERNPRLKREERHRRRPHLRRCGPRHRGVLCTRYAGNESRCCRGASPGFRNARHARHDFEQQEIQPPRAGGLRCSHSSRRPRHQRPRSVRWRDRRHQRLHPVRSHRWRRQASHGQGEGHRAVLPFGANVGDCRLGPCPGRLHASHGAPWRSRRVEGRRPTRVRSQPSSSTWRGLNGFAATRGSATRKPVVSSCARAPRSDGDRDRRQFYRDARTGLPQCGERRHARFDESLTATIRLQFFTRHNDTGRFDIVPSGQPLCRAGGNVRHGAPHRSGWPRPGLDTARRATFRAFETPNSRVGFLAPLYSALLIASVRSATDTPL